MLTTDSLYCCLFPLCMDIEINEITSKILKCAFKVHTALGPGLLESAYEDCLYHELKQNGILVEKQKSLPLMYSTIKVETGFRIDLMVEKLVVVEIKAVTELNDIHLAQVLTYLKLSNCKIGLLINFNVTSLKFGVRRVIR